MWRLVWIAILGVSLVGCGQRFVDDGLAQAPDAAHAAAAQPGVAEGDLGAALALWERFPVGSTPRPFVLLDDLPQVGGFTTDGAKEATGARRFVLTGPLPESPETVTVHLPGGPLTLPALPVEDAWQGLAGGATPDPAQALPITGVELGTAEFRTDRGLLTLPSWLFHSADEVAPIAWPALRPEAFWQPERGPGTSGLHADATGAAGGRTLTVSLPALPYPCPGAPVLRREPVVAESATAVAVGWRDVEVTPGTPADCPQPAMLRYEPLEVQLDVPLGARVLVDHEGNAFALVS